ncbi:hypothetical protein BB559_005437 [Furculomyces boomerangus]|uniref:CFA20 domain-containing protein n=2 Tax=Harpellales TaxID=61421 RepID=A0A2T9Y8Q6_9FUNG|nr:hypothetical protein BB559_005437 [Furculomyces boomerangus]PWA01090.1 hypothetical protein BB558_002823 [Smittium angustum]
MQLWTISNESPDSYNDNKDVKTNQNSDSSSVDQDLKQYLNVITKYNNHVQLVTDSILRVPVLRIFSDSLPFSFISCPPGNITLGIKLPIAILLIHTRVTPQITTMPLRLEKDWNQVAINLADLTRKCYSSQYKETSKIHIHSSAHIQRIYFSDKIQSESDLPPEFRLYLPVEN